MGNSIDFDISWTGLWVKIISYPYGFNGLLFHLVKQDALKSREIQSKL